MLFLFSDDTLNGSMIGGIFITFGQMNINSLYLNK